jgi:hypothetical protein
VLHVGPGDAICILEGYIYRMALRESLFFLRKLLRLLWICCSEKISMEHLMLLGPLVARTKAIDNVVHNCKVIRTARRIAAEQGTSCE